MNRLPPFFSQQQAFIRRALQKSVILLLACFTFWVTLATTAHAQLPSDFAIDLDGNGDFIAVPDNNALDLTNGFTLEAWVKPDAIDGNIQRIIGKVGAYGFGFNDSILRFTTYGIQDYNVAYNLPAGQWSHLAVVFDANNDATFYVNENKVGTVTGSAPANTSGNPLNFGQSGNLSEFLTGTIDEVRIWNTARTPLKIIGNFTNTLYGSETGLVAYYPLENGSGSTANDQAGSNDGTLNGNFNWTTANAPVNVQEQPINDDIDNAIPLTVNAGRATYTNIKATKNNYPGEPAGRCHDLADDVQSSVWFTFVAPGSGAATVSTDFPGGTLDDSQLVAFPYVPPSTPRLPYDLPSQIGCDEDSGTGRLAVMDLTDLTPGDKYYVQVDGFNSEVGTFDIAVTDPTTSGSYCTSMPLYNEGNGITNILLKSTDYLGNDNTYLDFTDNPPPQDLPQGVYTNLQIDFETGYSYDTNVWIDLNDNYIFEPSELIFSGTSTNHIPTTLNASFIMPSTAPLGNHRMRIVTVSAGLGGVDGLDPDPCYGAGSGVTADFIVNITSLPSFLPPSVLTATNISPTTAELDWAEDGTATTWDAHVIPAGDPVPAGSTTPSDPGITSKPFVKSGLAPETEYDFYVRSNYGSGDLSSWTGPNTFKTDCAPRTAPWADDVEGHTPTNRLTDSNCWTTIPDNSGPSDVYDWNISNSDTPNPKTGPNAAHSGTNFFYVASNMTGPPAKLITPVIDISSLTTPALTFYYHMFGTATGDLHVDIHDGTSWVNDVVVISGQQQRSGSAPWLSRIVNLSAYSGSIQVRFRAVDTGKGGLLDGGDISLDDISVREAPSYFPPTDLAAANATATTVDLSWTDNNTPAAPSWDVEIVPAGSVPSGTLTASGVTNPYTATGLQSCTLYDYYVRVNSGDGEYSRWSSAFTFSSGTGPVGSFSESFDLYPDGVLPGCWSSLSDGAGAVVEIDGPRLGDSSEKTLEFEYSGPVVAKAFAITPQLADLANGTHQIRFQGRADTDEVLEIGTMTDPTDKTTFNPIQTIAAATSYQKFAVLFPPTTDDYIAFRGNFTGTAKLGDYSYINIDNLHWEPAPPPPNDALADAIALTVDATSFSNDYRVSNATAETNEPDGSCLSSNIGTNTAWFKFTALSSRNLTVTTDLSEANLNTQVVVYEAPGDDSNLSTLGKEVGCNDDTDNADHYNLASTVELTGLTAGNTYYIQVKGNNSANGLFGIEVHTPPITPGANNIIYVNKNGSGGNQSGDSWAHAVPELSFVLQYASQNESNWTTANPLKIWVAAGMYKPGLDETDSFKIPNNIKLLGGFDGTETTANKRDWNANKTYLSGDLNNSNAADTGDSHTIVTAVDDNVTIDGFIIEHSYADDPSDNSQVAIGRAGGGIYARGSANLVVNNAIFRANIAVGDGSTNGVGGAIINFLSDITLTNCLFYDNEATAGGGAISGESGIVNLINDTIANNNAASGGGLNVFAAQVSIINTVFSNNAGNNGNIQHGGSGSVLASYTLFYNTTCGNSGNLPNNVADGGNNLFSQTPGFKDANNNDYQLEIGSIAIDAGDKTANSLPKELAGNPRVFNTTIDMGAYEGPLRVAITGSEGWRMMSSPSGGVSYAALLDTLWLQGITGGDVTNGAPNLYTWDEAVQQFEPVTDASTIPAAGQGFIVYVYDDQDYDGTPDGFPKIVQVDYTQNNGTIAAPLTYNDDGDASTINDGFNLVGNPYGATIDWDNSGVNKTNLNASIYIWDSSAGGGAGAYLTWNGATGTLSTKGLIAPWQGFWVQANGASPSLEFTDPSRSAGGVFYGAPGSSSDDQPVPQVKFSLEECTAERCSAKPAGQRPALQSRAIVMFSPEAELGRDRLDALKLQSLNADYLSLYTTSSEGSALDINALPLADSLQAAMNVDMNLKGSALGGAYTLSWTPKDLPTGWSATLTDTHSGTEVDLGAAGDYTFGVTKPSESSEPSEGSPGNASGLAPPTGGALPTVLKAKVANPRFTLTFAPAKAPGRDIPQALSISEAYPNPFRSRCNIELGLPEKTPVHVVVYDILGRKVATVADKEMSAGYHTLTMDAAQMGIASGVYLCRLKIGTKTKTMKMTFIK